ncbi:hypothetical protein SRABI128_06095 [Microbacterium sp. Bi128]|nr:hypothetical protein SRABI128_06095 [Microbacterium sp. Bi128]
MPGVDDLRLELDGRAVLRGLDRVFLDVEPQLVEPPDPGGHAPAFPDLKRFLCRQLGPPPPVAVHDQLAGGHGVHLLLDQAAVEEVHEFPGDVDAGDFEVVLALAGGQIRVQFAGLGIDQVGGERAGVAAEQGVGERDVAPVEADQVQPDQQQGLGVDEAGQGVLAQHLGEERTVGHGELQVPGDQHRVQWPALRGGASGDDGHRLHAGNVQPGELAQHVVFVAGHVLRGFLDGDHGAAEVGEAHDVP